MGRLYRRLGLALALLAVFPVQAQEATVTPGEVWAGDLLFVSDRDGGYDIYALNIESGETQRLTDSARDEFSPLWSPAGTQIAIGAVEDGNPDVYLMDAACLNVPETCEQSIQRLTDYDGFDEPMSWTPDGTRILMTSERDGQPALYLLDVATGEVEPLTMHPVVELPDEGEWMVFASDHEGDADIYLLDAATGTIFNLTDAPGHQGSPTLSPDGQYIAFVQSVGRNTDIYLMSVAGSEAQKLTDAPGFDHGAVWTPDSQHILFISDRDSNNEVYIMNLDGSDPRNLTNNPAQDASPAPRPLAEPED